MIEKNAHKNDAFISYFIQIIIFNISVLHEDKF